MKRKGIKSPNMLDALSMTMIEPKTKKVNKYSNRDIEPFSIC
jgi:hypothetical protein